MLFNKNYKKKKQRHNKTSLNNKLKKKEKRSLVFLGIVLFAIIFFLLVFGINEINRGVKYAEKLREQINISFFAIIAALLSLVGAFMATKNKLSLFGKAVVAVLAIFLVCSFIFGFGFCVYAGHVIAHYETEIQDTADTSKSEPEVMPLKTFEWPQNLFVQNLEEYLGSGADVTDIEGLLIDYLQTPMELVENDMGEYEKYVDTAGGFYEDFQSAGMEETKLFALEKEELARSAADENYNDSDNLKLYGDCFVNIGDISQEKAVESYKNALEKYIKALHVAYHCVERTPAIPKEHIWAAISDVYGKLAGRSDLQDIERERARELEEICAQISKDLGGSS